MLLTFHLSSLSLDDISTGINLKVIASITFHPITFFISFLLIFTFYNCLVYLFTYVSIVYLSH